MNEIKIGLGLTPIAAVLAVLVAVFMGNTAATIILTVIGSVLLIGLGAGIVIVNNHMADGREQRRFRENAVQDVQLMQGMLRSQNLLIRGQQMQNQQPALPSGGLLFNDAVFKRLGEQVEDSIDADYQEVGQ